MSDEHEKNEERVDDLDVPESESEDVKGGLLPAVKIEQKFQKVDIAQKFNPGAARFGDGSV